MGFGIAVALSVGQFVVVVIWEYAVLKAKGTLFAWAYDVFVYFILLSIFLLIKNLLACCTNLIVVPTQVLVKLIGRSVPCIPLCSLNVLALENVRKWELPLVNDWQADSKPNR